MSVEDFEPIRQSAWMARSTINFSKKNRSIVRIAEVVHLASDLVAKVMSRTFEVVSRDAHYITVAARAILSDRVSGKIYQEDEVFKAELAISEQFTRINDYFDRRIEQAKQRIRLAGADPDTVFARRIAYEAECTTRTATDYLQILAKADIYLMLHEFLWIKGELSDMSDNPVEALRAKLNNEREVRSHLLSIPRKTTNQFQIVHRICRCVMNQRQEQRQEQSNRDKKRHAELKKGVVVDALAEPDVLGVQGGTKATEPA